MHHTYWIHQYNLCDKTTLRVKLFPLRILELIEIPNDETLRLSRNCQKHRKYRINEPISKYRLKCALIKARELDDIFVNLDYVTKQSCGMRRRSSISSINMAQIIALTLLLTTLTGRGWLPTAAHISTVFIAPTTYTSLLRQCTRQKSGWYDQGLRMFCRCPYRRSKRRKITTDNILIATDGSPRPPRYSRYGIQYRLRWFFKLDAILKRAAIAGASYIAVKIFDVLNALIAETHLFIRKQAFRRTFNPMLVETLLEVMSTEGLYLYTESMPKFLVKKTDDNLTLQWENSQEFIVNSLIWAISYQSAINNLSLAVTGIKTN